MTFKFMVRHTLAWASLFGLMSCGSAFVGDDPANTPGNNFELLWLEYDRWFANFGHKNIDWQAQHDIYRPQVTSATTDEELWEIITNMMSELKDPHSQLRWPDHKYFDSGDADFKAAQDLHDLDLVSTFLTNKGISEDRQFYYGKAADNIGYFYITDFAESRDGDVIGVLEALGDIDGLIIDIRSSEGGSGDLAHEIASVFIDQRRFGISSQTRNGPGHEDFSPLVDWYMEPHSDYHFLKPIVLLTNRASLSASDDFALMLAELPHVTLMGDNTSGAMSSTSFIRFLPNGWQFLISHRRTFNSAGLNLEGIGIEPDIYVPATREELDNGEDKVLEAAIELLQENLSQ